MVENEWRIIKMVQSGRVCSKCGKPIVGRYLEIKCKFCGNSFPSGITYIEVEK